MATASVTLKTDCHSDVSDHKITKLINYENYNNSRFPRGSIISCHKNTPLAMDMFDVPITVTTYTHVISMPKGVWTGREHGIRAAAELPQEAMPMPSLMVGDTPVNNKTPVSDHWQAQIGENGQVGLLKKKRTVGMLAQKSYVIWAKSSLTCLHDQFVAHFRKLKQKNPNMTMNDALGDEIWSRLIMLNFRNAQAITAQYAKLIGATIQTEEDKNSVYYNHEQFIAQDLAVPFHVTVSNGFAMMPKPIDKVNNRMGASAPKPDYDIAILNDCFTVNPIKTKIGARSCVDEAKRRLMKTFLDHDPNSIKIPSVITINPNIGIAEVELDPNYTPGTMVFPNGTGKEQKDIVYKVDDLGRNSSASVVTIRKDPVYDNYGYRKIRSMDEFDDAANEITLNDYDLPLSPTDNRRDGEIRIVPIAEEKKIIVMPQDQTNFERMEEQLEKKAKIAEMEEANKMKEEKLLNELKEEINEVKKIKRENQDMEATPPAAIAVNVYNDKSEESNEEPASEPTEEPTREVLEEPPGESSDEELKPMSQEPSIEESSEESDSGSESSGSSSDNESGSSESGSDSGESESGESSENASGSSEEGSSMEESTQESESTKTMQEEEEMKQKTDGDDVTVTVVSGNIGNKKKWLVSGNGKFIGPASSTIRQRFYKSNIDDLNNFLTSCGAKVTSELKIVHAITGANKVGIFV